MLAMAYGYEVKDLNDRIVKLTKRMIQMMGEIALPGALLVNVLPSCEYLVVFDDDKSNANLP